MLCIAGVQSSSIAQEITTAEITTITVEEEDNFKWYFGFGVAVPGDYKINENLRAAGMPEIEGAMPELTIGYTVMQKKFLMDMEFNADYIDKKTSTDRAKGVVAGFKLRGHYVGYNNGNYFLSGGADLSYTNSTFSLYTRNNVVDLENLNPAAYTGHINLNNDQFYAGPSIAFGAFQQSEFPMRLNVGYEWSLINGRWKSEFANVDNTFREDTQGRFYAKLCFLF